MKYHYPMKNGKPHGEIPVDKDNHTCDASRYLCDYLAQIGYMGDYIQAEWEVDQGATTGSHGYTGMF